jgi:hypothetical protein
VRPQLQQQQVNLQQNQALQNLRRDVTQVQSGAYAPSNTLPQTGRGASFLNYSHYYQMGPAGSPRRQR